MQEITVQKNPNPKPKLDPSTVPFGTTFTDHMFIMEHTNEKGWTNPRIVPFGDISLHPGATVLHYSTEVFEGLKAYRRQDGHVQLFRPDENMKRMNNSAERLGLPQIDVDFCVEAIRRLVELDADWVPKQDGTSLYIRPFMFGTDVDLGLHGNNHVTFMIILSPVAAYGDGLKPCKILIESEDVRAVRGGTGYAKTGGNYSAATRAADKAAAKGYGQVLWLDGVERKYIEEVGSMNVMFKINGAVVTPALLGSVLPGITRKSGIQVLKEWGVPVEERRISVEELAKAAKDGALEEAWGIGTAAVVSPIGTLYYEGVEYPIGGGTEIGPLTKKFHKALTDIQWGRAADPYGWTLLVK